MSQPAPGPRSSTPWLPVVAVVAALVVALAGCSTGKQSSGSTKNPTTSPAPTRALPGTDPRLRKFYAQKIHWHDCSGNRCGHFEVPLDYAHPGGRSIRIAVLKVPASGKRIGSLVVNPGGPGGSGIEYAAAGSLQFGQRLASRYDIVGFDPRGVGASTPLHCLGTREMDKVVSFDPDPETAAERHEMDALWHAFGEGCVKRSGALVQHVSTVEAARDMDILRAVLGSRKLDYMGASYGTYLGATYAGLYPTHVGRFVLDGAVDPALSNRAMAIEQAHGFETALRAYLQDCVDQGGCFLGDTVEAGAQRIRALYDQLEKQPMKTDDPGRPLTEGLGMIGTWLPLYVKSYWPQLTEALRAAIEHGDGSKLLSLADFYLGRGSRSYRDNSMEMLNAVNCLDHPDSVPSDEVPKEFPAFEKASPTFGKAFAFSLSSCADWPAKGDRKSAPIRAAGAPPIVVVGTTRDPATPLKWAEALASELASGRLIVRDGDGHTGFQQGNACVDSAVEDFLIKGKVPPKRLAC